VDKEKRRPLKIDRKYIRLNTEIPCHVGIAGEEAMPATILDVSVGGLKFGCSQATVKRILADDRFVLGRIMDVEIVLRFSLKQAAGGDAPIECRARVIHSERLAQDLFHVGVQFLDLSQTTAAALDSYIAEHTTTEPAGG
jgi:hypothetical protein